MRSHMLKYAIASRLSWQSEELVLQGHVRFWLKTNAGAEDIGQSTALLG